jgi:hypothetical protein
MVYGHSPGKIDIKFDSQTFTLEVKFDHKVNNRENHFVDLVTVRLNSNEVIQQKLKKQDSINGGTLVYKITDAKPGDTIEVKLKCNKIGMKKETLIIE